MKYRLLMATVTEAELDKAILPAVTALRGKLRLSSGTPNQLMRAFGIADLWNEVKVDRLMTLLSCLDSNREAVRGAAEAMLFLEQKIECSENFILSVPHCKHRGWSGTWVGDIRLWMDDNSIKVTGAPQLLKLRIGDEMLANAVQDNDEEERGWVTHGCWCRSSRSAARRGPVSDCDAVYISECIFVR